MSHDRYFISKTANKIWEIVDHKIKEFKGGYEEYVEWTARIASEKERQNRGKSDEPGKSSKSNEANDSTSDGTIDKKEIKHKQSSSSAENKELKKELQKQQRVFQQLEQKISGLKERKLALEAALADPATYFDKTKFLQTEAEYKKIIEDLGKLNLDYERVFEKIIDLEK